MAASYCSADVTPFVYLGLPVGATMPRVANWDVVEQKMAKKLNAWKAKNLSIGGRVTLIKSALSSLPM